MSKENWFPCSNSNGTYLVYTIPVIVRVRFRANKGGFAIIFVVKGKFPSHPVTRTLYTLTFSTHRSRYCMGTISSELFKISAKFAVLYQRERCIHI